VNDIKEKVTAVGNDTRIVKRKMISGYIKKTNDYTELRNGPRNRNL
jgi:hypothetical protein